MDYNNLPRGKCSYCGKEIPIRDIRDTKPRYCNRAHASMARFSTRYQGTMAGPADRPKNLDEKLKKL